MLHYFIIATIIVIIVVRQWHYYNDTCQRIDILKNIFPESEIYKYNSGEEESYCAEDIPSTNKREGITAKHYNNIFVEIIRSINAYLHTNKGQVSDYHLMKDIVDRNCDNAEEEIDSQIPVPLYLGLMGTMAGILVGVGYLWISGDLNALLEAGNNTHGAVERTGADGVKALLGGVALAMVSSIMGIFLTTRGSMQFRDARSVLKNRKHTFLSWMQANMLPHLNNDTALVLEKMTRNLAQFNQEFYGNTKELGAALSQVNETTRNQAQLIESVNQLADKHVAKQNLDLYNALRNSSEEIGKLAELLHDSTEYLDAVRKLNARLDKGERRNAAIEHMVEFFEAETQQIEQRKGMMTQAIGKIDSTLEENLRQLGQHANKNVEGFYQALGKQQDALQKKLGETELLIHELRNLSPIKESISRFERATREQSSKIDSLTSAINRLVDVKTTSNMASNNKQSKKRKWTMSKFNLFRRTNK